MINKQGLKFVIGSLIGAFIGAFVVKFTQPIVWIIIVIILALLLIIDWNKLVNKNERDTEEKD